MERLAKDARQWAGEAALGLAGCLVGVWLAARLRGAWIWALLQQDGAEFVQRRFETAVTFPADAPWQLHAAGEFGSVLLFALGFGAAILAAVRLKGVAALWMACLAFGLATPIGVELAGYLWSRPSALGRLLQGAGLPLVGPLVRPVISAFVAIAVALLLRAALRRTELLPVSAFTLPACAIQLLLSDGRNFNSLPAFTEGSALLLAAVAIAAGLSASTPRQRLRVPPPRALAVLGSAGCLGLLAPEVPPVQQEPVRWSANSSRNWSIQFESEHFTTTLQLRWLEGAEARLAAYGRRLGLPGSEAPITAYVASSERAFASRFPRRQFGERRSAGSGAPPVILSGPDELPENREIEPLLAMRRAWGEPASATMARAIARYAVGEFFDESLQAAAARIACEESHHSPQSVFATDGRYLSRLVRAAAGGAWVENAVERSGIPVVKQLYGNRLAEALASCDDCLPPCPAEFEPAPPRPPETAYWKGISFSHEGRGSRGYGSASADRELRRIREIGANAVALVPYAFTRAPEETSIRFRTLETDVRVARSIRQARELGLRVMLKPHLWAGDRFHGSISFDRKDRFSAWFEDYRRWILHYARFAEIHRIDILSIGNELAGLSVHEDAWRGLIRDVRRVFRGPLTYAAHWRSEVAELGFWDDLDFVGVNFYFPIAGRRSLPEPDSPEMTAASELIARVQARSGKPVLFTEVGFPALATAASRPWEENGSPLDADLQAQCYEAWLARFAQGSNTAGMFWWKWPSDGRGGPFDASHRPLGKPAIQVLKDWFGRL